MDSLKFIDFGLNKLIKATIYWIFNNITRYFATRREDLHDSRPGSVASHTEPILIWVKMLTHPSFIARDTPLGLNWKFNKILKDIVAEDKYSHIMEINTMTFSTAYNQRGDLTSSGKYEFWSAIIDKFRRFDRGDIELLLVPRVAKLEQEKLNHQSWQEHPRKRHFHDVAHSLCNKHFRFNSTQF